MLRVLALAVALAAAGDQRPPLSVRIDPSGSAINPAMAALPVHVGGRTLRTAQGFRHQWPGIYFEARFRGPRVTLRFDDAVNLWRASIDDAPPVAIDRPGKADVTLAGLSPGAHRIRIDKVTESSGPALFGGFYVARGKALPAPSARRRQIEFIGDSSMAGYGARSGRTACTPEEVRSWTDTPDAFAALAARHYGADYQVNAVSGRGLIRNVGGTAPNGAMVALYQRALPAKPAPFADPRWQPQIVMLKLQADFVGFRPDRRWPDMGALAADYVAGYGRFLGTLHRRYPRAVFVLWWFDSAAAAPEQAAMLRAAEAQISETARAAGVPDLLFLPFPAADFPARACHGHYDLEQHHRIAGWLISAIDAHPDFWDGRPAYQ